MTPSQQGFSRHFEVAAAQLGRPVTVNGATATAVQMPPESSEVMGPGGRIEGVVSALLFTAEEWARIGGALNHVVVLSTGLRGRILKVTTFDGGVLADIGSENQRGSEAW